MIIVRSSICASAADQHLATKVPHPRLASSRPGGDDPDSDPFFKYGDDAPWRE